ncbi:hypothetical protein AYO20_06541 [Fonsecaea nubica]|uniref:Uncharacterized protein n=1 Tax=Fonsecaea nubica TaxID=856822 RepID=A0A178CX98_9EURO|nr:hypothetical protein AYO20_06541 [Fonsecaea nubica]OAL34086.1 hypothetical protein AYO20_06541 [Fonsecaea nubica]
MSNSVDNHAPPVLGEEDASLVSDEILLRLWNQVQQDPQTDNVALNNFWLHLYAKHLFPGKQWIVGVENGTFDIEPPKKDLTVQFLGHTGPQALFFHMHKGKEATRDDLIEVETQALVACLAYLTANPGITKVYAVTSFGARARIWCCGPKSMSLEPLFGSYDLADASAYVEAHSSEAITLRRGFADMKRFAPVARRGINHGSGSPASSRRN